MGMSLNIDFKIENKWKIAAIFVNNNWNLKTKYQKTSLDNHFMTSMQTTLNIL